MMTSEISSINKNVLILGVTFKKIRLRNSKIPIIVSELKEYGYNVFIYDPADKHEVHTEYSINLSNGRYTYVICYDCCCLS